MDAADAIEIFRSGTHTAESGRAIAFSDADLAAIAAAYDPATHEAPIVVGHPTTDAPAYGWIAGLAVAEGRLQATPAQLDPSFAEIVKAGRFKKISASFYAPDSPANPKPGQWYLKHVGFLGAAPPAVKGLKQVAFNAAETGVETIDLAEPPAASEMRLVAPAFSEPASTEPAMPEPDPAAVAALEARERDLATREAAFAERQRALRAADDQAFVASLVKSGRLPKGLAATAATLLTRAPEAEAVSFAEGAAAETDRAALSRLLAALPAAVEFREIAATDGAPQADGTVKGITAAADALVKARRDAGQSISFREAVAIVSKENAA